MRGAALVALFTITIPVLAEDPVAAALAWNGTSAGMRFLAIPPEKDEEFRKSLLFAVNSTNLRNRFVDLAMVNDSLIAVHLDGPGWDYQSWEALGARNSYFRGPWIESRPEWAALCAATASKYPIIRADEFVAKATVGGPGGYYDLLYGYGKVKTRAELLTLLGVDPRFDGLRVGGVMAFNPTVTTHGRQLYYTPGPIPHWRSDDVRSDTGRGDVLRNFNIEEGPQDDLEIAGQEYIFPLRNGLIGAFLNDAAGNRVDEVPKDIARGEVNHPDGRVRAGRSCLSCHSRGIRHFTPDEHELLQKQVLQLSTTNKQLALKFENLFDPQAIEDLISDGQTAFTRSAFRLTGEEQMSGQFAAAWNSYSEGRIGIDDAVRECGVKTREELLPAMVRLNDPNGLALIPQDGVAEKRISRTKWEEIYPLVMWELQHPEGAAAPANILPVGSSKVKLPAAAKTYKSDRQDLVTVGKPVDGEYPVEVQSGATWVEFELTDGTKQRFEVKQ